MNVRPFFLLGATQLSLLKESLVGDLTDWAFDWFNGEVDIECKEVFVLESVSDDSSQETFFRVKDPTGGQWAIFPSSPAIVERLCSQMLYTLDMQSNISQDISVRARSASLVTGIVRESLMDLSRRIMNCSGMDGVDLDEEGTLKSCIPGDTFKQGKGVLQVNIQLNDVLLSVCFPVVPLLEARQCSLQLTLEEDESGKTLSTTVLHALLKEALADKPIMAEAILGGAELSLGELVALKVGDVIQLDQSLSEPLTLEFDQSPTKFKGYLGQQQGRLVLQVADILNERVG